MKVYISIPIIGENYNDQRNHAFIAATNLGLKGWDVVSPFDVTPRANMTANEIAGKHFEVLLNCDAIYLCKGWQQSKKCQAELQIALVYGKEIITE